MVIHWRLTFDEFILDIIKVFYSVSILSRESVIFTISPQGHTRLDVSTGMLGTVTRLFAEEIAAMLVNSTTPPSITLISLDLLVSAHYFKLDADFKADIGTTKIKYSNSGYILDGIIGARTIIDLNERLYL